MCQHPCRGKLSCSPASFGTFIGHCLATFWRPEASFHPASDQEKHADERRGRGGTSEVGIEPFGRRPVCPVVPSEVTFSSDLAARAPSEETLDLVWHCWLELQFLELRTLRTRNHDPRQSMERADSGATRNEATKCRPCLAECRNQCGRSAKGQDQEHLAEREEVVSCEVAGLDSKPRSFVVMKRSLPVVAVGPSCRLLRVVRVL